MDTSLLLSLGALALVDSLSVGTLLVPIFFLIAPGRLRFGRILLYLATIAAFYFAVGVLLLSGARWFADAAESVAQSTIASWLQLVIGGALLGGALVFGKSAPKPGSREADEMLARPPGRLGRWRDAAMGSGGSGALVAVALGAGMLELATMLPYLAAVGLLTQTGLPIAQLVAVLAGYCAVMIMPALVLLVGRAALRRLLEPPLQRLARWLQLNGPENTAWIVGIVGFLLFRDAADRVALFAQLGIG